jgi:hypothetical protein
MLPVANISITKSAEATLRQQRSRTRPSADEVLGMTYVEFFTEPDGSTVKGFVPGYQAGSWRMPYITQDWIRVNLSGMDVYIMPKFKWSPRERYVIDMAGGSYAMFSINRVT